ncbi:MAG TPA: NADH-quinone oxidoreductase subunit A [bacterium]|nr:NADH-quinone oxidoreductase subunit A [bacterium]
MGLTVALLALHALLGGSRPTPPKLEPYESGVWAIGSARERVPIRYYLIAMLFILFDIETVFLYPWAVVARRLGIFGLIEMLVFIGVLGLGLIYAWKRGALEWQ